MLGIAMSESFENNVAELRRRWPSREMDQTDETQPDESRGERTEPRCETAIFDEDTQIMNDDPETAVERLSTERLNERYR